MDHYPSYQKLDNQWIGKIPTHWKFSSLKWYSTIYAGGTPSKNVEKYWENGSIPWLNSGAVNQGDISVPSNYITEEAYNNSSAKWIPEDGLVMALAGQGKTKGMVAQLKILATCNQSMAAIVPKESVESRYILYWLRVNYENIRNLAGGDNRDGLNLQIIGSIPFPIPPVHEQTQIARYLDYKTAKIDELIAKKQRLIQLLEEERTAIINQAVTKGLNPDVPMKDSGIEWLGDIPEHWEVKKLKYLISEVKGGGTPSTDVEEYWNGDIPWVSPKDMKSSTINSTVDYITTTAVNNSSTVLIPARSLMIVVRSGILKHTLPLALNEVEVALNQDMKALFFNEGTSEDYVYWLFKGVESVILTICSKIGATVDSIDMNILLNFKLPVPPTLEQEIIKEQINSVFTGMKSSVERMQKEVELLKEYKTALISEVVTGKVDVRDEVIPEN